MWTKLYIFETYKDRFWEIIGGSGTNIKTSENFDINIEDWGEKKRKLKSNKYHEAWTNWNKMESWGLIVICKQNSLCRVPRESHQSSINLHHLWNQGNGSWIAFIFPVFWVFSNVKNTYLVLCYKFNLLLKIYMYFQKYKTKQVLNVLQNWKLITIWKQQIDSPFTVLLISLIED